MELERPKPIPIPIPSYPCSYPRYKQFPKDFSAKQKKFLINNKIRISSIFAHCYSQTNIDIRLLKKTYGISTGGTPCGLAGTPCGLAGTPCGLAGTPYIPADIIIDKNNFFYDRVDASIAVRSDPIKYVGVKIFADGLIHVSNADKYTDISLAVKKILDPVMNFRIHHIDIKFITCDFDIGQNIDLRSLKSNMCINNPNLKTLLADRNNEYNMPEHIMTDYTFRNREKVCASIYADGSVILFGKSLEKIIFLYEYMT